jgi:transposase-like protein
MTSMSARAEARPKRREWTEAYARQIWTQWKASGLSVPAFAAQQGIHADRFYRWRRRFEAAGRPASTQPRPAVVPWVPLRAAPASESAVRTDFELDRVQSAVPRVVMS